MNPYFRLSNSFNKVRMKLSNLPPRTIKNIYFALVVSSIIMGFIIGRTEKGLYFGKAIIYQITFLFTIALSQKAIFYQRIERGQLNMYMSLKQTNKLNNIYLLVLTLVLISAIVYNHIHSLK